MRPTTRSAVLYASQGVTPPSLTDLQQASNPRVELKFSGISSAVLFTRNHDVLTPPSLTDLQQASNPFSGISSAVQFTQKHDDVLQIIAACIVNPAARAFYCLMSRLGLD